MDARLVLIAARTKRVMSDVVSIADLMRPSNYLAALGICKAMATKTSRQQPWEGKGGRQCVGKASNMHLLDNATNDDDDENDNDKQPCPPNLNSTPAPALKVHLLVVEGRRGEERRQTNKQGKRHISTASQQPLAHQSICSSVIVDCARCATDFGAQWDPFDCPGKIAHKDTKTV
ncbi:hypothetical protein ACLKA7_014970 [Drosophila subpalustris]